MPADLLDICDSNNVCSEYYVPYSIGASMDLTVDTTVTYMAGGTISLSWDSVAANLPLYVELWDTATDSLFDTWVYSDASGSDDAALPVPDDIPSGSYYLTIADDYGFYGRNTATIDLQAFSVAIADDSVWFSPGSVVQYSWTCGGADFAATIALFDYATGQYSRAVRTITSGVSGSGTFTLPSNLPHAAYTLLLCDSNDYCDRFPPSFDVGTALTFSFDNTLYAVGDTATYSWSADGAAPTPFTLYVYTDLEMNNLEHSVELLDDSGSDSFTVEGSGKYFFTLCDAVGYCTDFVTIVVGTCVVSDVFGADQNQLYEPGGDVTFTWDGTGLTRPLTVELWDYNTYTVTVASKVVQASTGTATLTLPTALPRGVTDGYMDFFICDADEFCEFAGVSIAMGTIELIGITPYAPIEEGSTLTFDFSSAFISLPIFGKLLAHGDTSTEIMSGTFDDGASGTASIDLSSLSAGA